MLHYKCPEKLVSEIDQFEEDISDFIGGRLHPVKFKGLRVAHGIYEQRQPETYMVRIRCAAGVITPKQLKKVADLGHRYGSGEVHFTTRQEVQIHNVLIENVITVIKELQTVGLSTRGGGGNTIRNILTSSKSGVDPEEVFDVDPYAIALTTRMISEDDSWNLPRKFKIAFSNGPHDTAFTQTTCLGFVAKIENGQKGFEVYCAGGMGARPMIGHCLFDFVPDTQVYHITKAIKIAFDKHGNRRSKYSSRIKFLWKKLGRSSFEDIFYEEYNKIKDDRELDLHLLDIENTAQESNLAPKTITTTAFDKWKTRYTSEQKQSDLFTIKLTLRLGDLMAEDAERLCNFLSEFGENTIRCERNQNIRLRNIPKDYLGNLYELLNSLKDTLHNTPSIVGNMVNCTGAQTCKLGICLPRGLSDAIRDQLNNSTLQLDQIPQFRINMSGCPNTCGMHHIADLGFFGKIGRKNGDVYPAYNVLAGAKVGESGKTEYAKKQGEIPAHFIPKFVEEFLANYIEKKDSYNDYHAFLDAEGVTLIKDLCEKYKDIPDMDTDKHFYIDFGAEKPLSLEELGTAECSAGMFDMINVDKKAILELQKTIVTSSDINNEENLHKLLFHTSRMLLVTRGLDAKTDEQAFDYFIKHFCQTQLVKENYQDILTLAKLGMKSALLERKNEILNLSNDILKLYDSMDDSLRFRNLAQENTQNSTTEKDLRGVACPMNFVKTKLALDTLVSGTTLSVLLDDGAPINNVPNSIKLEGHTILEQKQYDEGHWSILIKKK